MQHTKQASAKQGTDDSDDQITNDSFAFPFCDEACELAGHQANQQEQNNIHYHMPSLPVWGGVLPLVLWCQDRIVTSNIWRLHGTDRVVIIQAAEKAASAVGETRPNLGIIAVWQDGYQPGLRRLRSATG